MSDNDKLLIDFTSWMLNEKGISEEMIFTMPTEEAFTYLHEYYGEKIKSDCS